MSKFTVEMIYIQKVIGTVEADSELEALEKTKEDLGSLTVDSIWGDVDIESSDGSWADNYCHARKRDDD